jgi:hypothetical protein
VSAEPTTDGVHAAEPAAFANADSSSAATEHAEESHPELPGTPSIQPPASGPPVSTRSPYRAIENTEGATEVTAAGESLDMPQVLDEPQALDELEANAQDAVRAAAADPSYKQPGAYNQSGDAVPTHHG